MRAKLLAASSLALLLVPVLLLRAQGTRSHPHGDLALDCGQCHTSERWSPLLRTPLFRHESTGFALEGSHAQAPCRGCHRSLIFGRVATACADCHQDAHRGALGFRCEACHTPRTWTNQREMFRAHDRMRFPLFAVHANLDCAACHRNQQPFEYANTPAECGACHLQTFRETRSPDHARLGFSQRCEDCHPVVSQSWRGARFDHPPSFPLVGGHARSRCVDCHAGGYQGTSTLCFDCHRLAFDSATSPNHRAGGFSTDCTACHQITGWRPATMDHNRTRFPLTGAHQRVDCSRCHVGGRYAGTPTDCYACHQADYGRAANPSHSGFPTRCEACHNTAAWRPASFDHNLSRFPLTGAHQRVDCARCHPGGRYAGTPTDCYACHQADYNGTASPNHTAAGFPTQCQNCHNTAAWRPASFDHDAQFFPIYSGKHRGKWSGCGDCHVNPGNYKAFECIFCHEHSNKAEVDDKHKRVAGYQYASRACYACHPRGRK